jgi:hypothetical protein
MWSSMQRVAKLSPVLALLALAPARHAQAVLDLRGPHDDHLGCALHAAGDFDLDGFPDMLVGADQRTKDVTRPGYVAGSVGILSGRNGSVLFRVSGNDYAARTGRAPGTGFGADAAMVGDLDSDGVCDVLVVHGNAKVLRQIAAFSGRTGAFLFELTDPHGNTDFGDAIVALGDLVDAHGNLVADGVPDFAVGAPNNSVFAGAPNYPGVVYVYSGAAPGAAVVTINGAFPQVAFGSALALVGDLDGDGLPALAVGAPNGGYVEIYDGPGFGSVLFLNTGSPLPSFGATLANVGDLDQDGTTELAIGAPAASQGLGRVLVYSLRLPDANFVTRLQPVSTAGTASFGASLAGLPTDPRTGRGLLDLDHDGRPDPFFDADGDGNADYLVGATGVASPVGGDQAGGVYFVHGSGAAFQLADVPLQQGVSDPLGYAFQPALTPRPAEWFGFRLALLGNAGGESSPRFAVGTPRDEDYDGGLAVLRLPFAHFDDDTFSRANDGVGTSRTLTLDFGPRYARRRYYLFASSTGTSPGQILQGFRVPLNDDGPGGLWRRTLTLQPAGSPLAFSQLTGRLDGAGRASITVSVTAPTLGHPWFATPRQHYLPVLTEPGSLDRLALVGAPTPLEIF